MNEPAAIPKRDAVIATLREHASELRTFGIAHLYLFGSVARGDASPESDVDLFFEYDDPKFSLIDQLRFRDRLQDLLHHTADVMSRSSLHPYLRDEIERGAVQVF